MQLLMLSDAGLFGKSVGSEPSRIGLSEVSNDTCHALIQRHRSIRFSYHHRNDKHLQPFFVYGFFGTNCEYFQYEGY